MKYLFFTIFLTLFAAVSAQTEMDSLLLQLQDEENDTVWVDNMQKVSWYLIDFDPIRALQYAEQSLERSMEIDYRRGIVEAYRHIGVIYSDLGSYQQSVEYFTRCIPIYEEMNDQGGLASVNNSLGRFWLAEGNWEQALSYFRQCNKIYLAINERSGIAGTYLNMGVALDYLGYPDSAMIYNEIAMGIYLELGNPHLLTSPYLNIGRSHQDRGEYELAREKFEQALIWAKRSQNKHNLTSTFLYLGTYYNVREKPYQAITYLDSAMLYASEMEGLEVMSPIAEELIKSYRMTGDYKQAADYYELNKQIEDSLDITDLAKELTKLEWSRILEQERKIQAQEMSRIILIRNFTLLALGLVIILAFFIYRNYRINQKANKILAEVDQLKSRMFSNISHEFRTPLTLILSPLEEILDADSDAKLARKTIQMMQRNAGKLLSLINQMLDLSRMDAGKLRLELVEADVLHTVRLMINSFSSLAEQKNISYKDRISHDKWLCYFDPDKLEKILNNLLSNALKFTPSGGDVRVKVLIRKNNKNRTLADERSGTEWLEIRVEDSGPGIPPDQLGKIFDRFHRVDDNKLPDSTGTGIGLSLVKELVELQHGKIELESEQGEGTKFIVNIPLDKDHLDVSEYKIIEKSIESKIHPLITVSESVPESDDEGGEEEPLEEQNPTLLIVEDNADIRLHIHDYIREDYIVLEEENGASGLKTALEKIPDLVVTDLMMPEMDGVELCKSLKTNELTSHVPVIMLTAKADVESRIEGLETGADDYITKPFNIKELSIRMKNLVRLRQELREKFSKGLSLEPREVAVTSYDERFLKRALEIVDEKMRDNNFDVTTFGEEIGMSRMQLFRKIKALTDQSPTEFIRTIRLKRAAQLIKANYGNLAEITYEVGFNHPSYFAKSFRELFGVAPSEYAQSSRADEEKNS